jgi:hypothetical protein
LFGVTGLVGAIGNMVSGISMRLQPAFTVWNIANRVQDFVGLVRLFSNIGDIKTVIIKEATKFLDELKKSPNISAISFDDIMYTFEYVLSTIKNEGIHGPFGTIATLHKKRLTSALLNLTSKKPDRLVIYLPTIPGKFVPDNQLIDLPEVIEGFPISISFGGSGGRLWGFGLAKPKSERTSPKTISYMLFRVDYHKVPERDHLHKKPYADFFRQNINSWEFHWQIPTSPNDAMGGRNNE